MKRIFALVISLLVVLAYVPAPSYGAVLGSAENPKLVSTGAGLNDAIGSYRNIKLTADISGTTIKIMRNETAVINLNGHTITSLGTAVSCGGDLTLKNGTIISTEGKAISAYTTKDCSGKLEISSCTVKGSSNAVLAGSTTSSFQSLSVTGSTLSSSRASAVVAYYGDVRIKDSTVKSVTAGKSAIYAYGLSLTADAAALSASGGAYGINLCSGSEAEVTGGSITYSDTGNAVRVGSKGKCLISTDISTTSSGAVFNVDGGTVSVNGGTISCKTIGKLNNNELSRIRISGGTFDFEPASKYIAGGYAAYESGGKWMIKKSSSSVTVTDAVSLQEAIDAEGSQIHIVLGKNITTTSAGYSIEIPEGKKVYLDLNGYYLKAPSGDYSAIFLDGALELKDTKGGGYVVEIAAYENSELILRSGTIKGGVIDCGSYDYGQSALRTYGKVTVYGGSITASKSTALDVCTSKTVNICGGTISTSSGNDAAVYVNQGELKVSGGTITGPYRGIWTSGAKASLTVTGGSIYSVFKDCGSTRTLKGGIYTKKPAEAASGYVVSSRSDGRYEIIKNHDYTSVITKATLTENGKIVKTCGTCGAKETVTISHPQKMILSYVKCAYSGKKKIPSVTIKNAAGKVIDSKYYTVAYGNNVNVGTGEVKVTFRTRYSGTMTRKFTIVPKKTSIRGLSAGKGYLMVKWYRKTIQNTGYQIRYSTSSSMKSYSSVKIKDNQKTEEKIKDLKSKKKYYVKIRTYKNVAGEVYYGNWSKVKSITVK